MAEGSFFRRHQSMRALAHRDFRLLLAGSAIVSFVMPVQFLTQVFWVEDHYAARQVLYVGLLGVSRGAAMLLFSLFGGAIADRFERRRVLLFCESTALGLNTLVALLMLTHPFGEATMIALLCLTFAAAGNMAIDMPARTASTPAIVGMEDLANGISLQMIAQQLATPLSLPLVGLLNSVFDSGQVYAGTLFAWVAILPLISMLRYRSVGEANRAAGVLGNIREGLAYTRRDATIFAVIATVFVIQVVGMPGPAVLGPVWMTDVMGLSKAAVRSHRDDVGRRRDDRLGVLRPAPCHHRPRRDALCDGAGVRRQRHRLRRLPDRAGHRRCELRPRLLTRRNHRLCFHHHPAHRQRRDARPRYGPLSALHGPRHARRRPCQRRRPGLRSRSRRSRPGRRRRSRSRSVSSPPGRRSAATAQPPNRWPSSSSLSRWSRKRTSAAVGLPLDGPGTITRSAAAWNAAPAAQKSSHADGSSGRSHSPA